MRLTNHRHGLFLFFVVAFALVGFRAPAAQAAPGNGATVIINVEDCFEFYEGYTECFGSKSVVNETVTPSGNTIFITNVRFSYRLTDGDENVLLEQSIEDHFHALTMDEALQVLSSRSRETTRNFLGETCTGRYTIHFANGQFQFAGYDFSCSSG